MLKQYAYGIKRWIIFVDIMILLFAFWLATFMRFGTAGTGFKNLFWIVVVSSIIIPVCFTTYGLYDFRYKTFGQGANRVVLSHCINAVVIAFIAYLWNIKHFSRFFMISFIFISMGIHLLLRLWIKKILNRLRFHGYNYRRTLIVGLSDTARRIIASIEANAHWGLRIVGGYQRRN